MLQKIRHEFRQGRTLLTYASLQTIGQGCAMLAPLIVANWLAPEQFASYSLAKMIAFFFVSLLIGAFQTPFVVYANEERSETGSICRSFSAQSVLLAASLCVFGVIAAVFRKPLIAFAQIAPGEYPYVLGAFGGMACKSVFVGLFMALGRRVRAAWVEIIYGVSVLVFLFGFYWTGTLTLSKLFAVYVLSGSLVVLLFAWQVDLKQLRPLTLAWRYLGGMFHFAKWIFVGATAGYFINWGDNLVLRAHVQMGPIGAYNLAYQIFKGIVMLIFVISTYFLPFVTEHIADREKMSAYLYRKRPRILAAGALLIALLIMAAPVMGWFYSDEYTEAIGLLRLLLIGAPAVLYTIFYTPVLNALKQYRVLQIVTTLQVLLNLGLDVILVPRMGPPGAAVATVLAYLFLAVMMEVYFRIRLRRLLGV